MFPETEEEIKKYLKALENTLKNTLPAGWGFSLFVAKASGKGTAFHVSSMEREEIKRLLISYLKAIRKVQWRN